MQKGGKNLRTEFYLRGLPNRFMRFVIEKIRKKEIICIAKAQKNLRGSEVNIFDSKFQAPISIRKGEDFFVVGGSENDYRAIKRWFFPFSITIYQAEEIFCQTKWKGQPYKFFFKDRELEKNGWIIKGGKSTWTFP